MLRSAKFPSMHNDLFPGVSLSWLFDHPSSVYGDETNESHRLNMPPQTVRQSRDR